MVNHNNRTKRRSPGGRKGSKTNSSRRSPGGRKGRSKTNSTRRRSFRKRMTRRRSQRGGQLIIKNVTVTYDTDTQTYKAEINPDQPARRKLERSASLPNLLINKKTDEVKITEASFQPKSSDAQAPAAQGQKQSRQPAPPAPKVTQQPAPKV